MIRCAVVGFGFMGVTHANQIIRHPDAELVAVVETDAKKIKQTTTGNIGVSQGRDLLAGVTVYQQLHEMLQTERVDCVSICLPTWLHRELAIEALQAGKHVICEKPMALTLADCDAMIAAAVANQRELIVAHCLRFWPEYEVLHRYLRGDELGAPLSLSFQRVSAPPFWSGSDSWFSRPDKSGGCLFDLHVHDVDFIQHALGRPAALFSQGLATPSGLNHSVMSQYLYQTPLLCSAESSWQYPLGFKMSFTSLFEKGLLQYDSTRNPTLLLTRSGDKEAQAVAPAAGDGYSREFDYYIDCLNQKKPLTRMTPLSARQSIEIALAEAASLQKGEKIIL